MRQDCRGCELSAIHNAKFSGGPPAPCHSLLRPQSSPGDATSRHGTSRHVTARHGTSRHGTARHVTARHGTARHGTARARSHRSPPQQASAQGRERREGQRQGQGAGGRAPGAGSLSESGQTRGERYWASTLVPLPDHPTPLSGPDGPDGPDRPDRPDRPGGPDGPDGPAKSDGAAELRTRAPPDRWARPSDLNGLANQPAIVAKPVRQSVSHSVGDLTERAFQARRRDWTEPGLAQSPVPAHGAEASPDTDRERCGKRLCPGEECASGASETVKISDVSEFACRVHRQQGNSDIDGADSQTSRGNRADR